MQKITKNPLVKIAVMLLIFYMCVFKNNNPNSLGNNINLDKLKNGIIDVKEKTQNISENIDKAKKIHQEVNSQKEISSLVFDQVVTGVDDKIKCGDEVNLMYKITNFENKIIDYNDNLNIEVGKEYQDTISNIIAKNIINLQKGSVAVAKIIGHFKDADEKFQKLLEVSFFNASMEIYVLSIKNIKKC